MIFCAILISLLIGWWKVDGPGAPKAATQIPLNLEQMSFQMIDRDRNKVGPKNLLGKQSIVFFGFTHCPDICPTTLSDISGWLNELGSQTSLLNAVFITVDPERDTAEIMAEYTAYFHPLIQGWRGTKEQTRRTGQNFRVMYEKVLADDSDYTVDHTASIFLFDQHGSLQSTIDYHEQREIALQKIRRLLQ